MAILGEACAYTKLVDLPEAIILDILYYSLSRQVRSLGYLCAAKIPSPVRNVSPVYQVYWGRCAERFEPLQRLRDFACISQLFRRLVKKSIAHRNIILLNEFTNHHVLLEDSAHHIIAGGSQNRFRVITPQPALIKLLRNCRLPLRSLDISSPSLRFPILIDDLHDLIHATSGSLQALVIPCLEMMVAVLSDTNLSELSDVTLCFRRYKRLPSFNGIKRSYIVHKFCQILSGFGREQGKCSIRRLRFFHEGLVMVDYFDFPVDDVMSIPLLHSLQEVETEFRIAEESGHSPSFYRSRPKYSCGLIGFTWSVSLGDVCLERKKIFLDMRKLQDTMVALWSDRNVFHKFLSDFGRDLSGLLVCSGEHPFVFSEYYMSVLADNPCLRVLAFCIDLDYQTIHGFEQVCKQLKYKLQSLWLRLTCCNPRERENIPLVFSAILQLNSLCEFGISMEGIELPASDFQPFKISADWISKVMIQASNRLLRLRVHLPVVTDVYDGWVNYSELSNSILTKFDIAVSRLFETAAFHNPCLQQLVICSEQGHSSWASSTWEPWSPLDDLLEESESESDLPSWTDFRSHDLKKQLLRSCPNLHSIQVFVQTIAYGSIQF